MRFTDSRLMVAAIAWMCLTGCAGLPAGQPETDANDNRRDQFPDYPCARSCGKSLRWELPRYKQ